MLEGLSAFTLAGLRVENTAEATVPWHQTCPDLLGIPYEPLHSCKPHTLGPSCFQKTSRYQRQITYFGAHVESIPGSLTAHRTLHGVPRFATLFRDALQAV